MATRSSWCTRGPRMQCAACCTEKAGGRSTMAWCRLGLGQVYSVRCTRHRGQGPPPTGRQQFSVKGHCSWVPSPIDRLNQCEDLGLEPRSASKFLDPKTHGGGLRRGRELAHLREEWDTQMQGGNCDTFRRALRPLCC